MTEFTRIESLITQLRNIDELYEIPWQTIDELRTAGETSQIELLIELFADPGSSAATLEATERILAHFGKAAVPALLQALESPEMEVRYRATITLGLIADPLAIEPLTRRFGDEEHDVSLEAGIALSKIGAEALPSILQAVDAPDSTTRSYALVALKYFDGPEVKAAILKSLSIENKGALFAAVGAAGRPGFIEATPGLVKLLEVTVDGSLEMNLIRAETAKSLGIIGDPQAINVLAQSLVDKYEYLAEEAAVALGRIGDIRSVVPLLEALRTNDHQSVRHYIVRALTDIGIAARPAAILALHDPAANVRFGAAMLLGNIGDTGDLDLLEALAENDEGETRTRAKVKTAARKAIKRIKERVGSGRQND